MRGADTINAAELLRRAAAVYDAPFATLGESARRHRWEGFHGGGEWMREAMGVMRAGQRPASPADFHRLGIIKYGLAAVCFVTVVALAGWWALPLAILAFYAVEAQLVFLFPLAIDGAGRPFSAAREWTRRAGGTLTVMGIVLQLAAVMMGGGLRGRGFLRPWCLGCLGVLLWYESLRDQ